MRNDALDRLVAADPAPPWTGLPEEVLVAEAIRNEVDRRVSIRRPAVAKARVWPAWGLAIGVGLILLLVTLALLLGPHHVDAPLDPSGGPAENGLIFVQGSGCSLMAINPINQESEVFSAGIPDCYESLSSYEMAWDVAGERLGLAYRWLCGRCVSDEAVAAINKQVGGVWVFDPESDSYRQVFACEELSCSAAPLSLSADGSKVAFQVNYRVVIASADSSGSPAVPNWDETVAATRPAWSPVEDALAYAVNRAEWHGIHIEPTGESSSACPCDFRSDHTVEDVSWSPTGESVVFSTRGADAEMQVGSIEGSDSPVPRTQTIYSTQVSSELVGHEVRLISPRWSPDGERIAVVRIEVVNSPGTSATAPGTQILSAEVLTMGPDGSNLETVFDGSGRGVLSDVAWSPDGRYLTLFTNGPALWVIRADGSEQTGIPLLAPLWAFDDGHYASHSAPAWRPHPSEG